MKLTRTSLTALLLVFASLCLNAQTVPEYSLEELWIMAQKSNESIKISENQLDMADAGVRMAWAELLPKVDATFLGNYYDQEQTIDFEGVSIEIFPRVSYTFTATLTQPVFTGFRVVNGIKLANRARGITENSDELTREMIYFGLAASYYQVVMYKREVRVLKEAIEVAKEEVEKAQLRFDVGEVTKPAVLLAELTLKDNERKLTERQNALRIAKVKLADMIGFEGDYNLKEPEDIETPSGNLDDLTARALNQRNELKMARLNKEIAGYEKSIAVGGLMPTIALQAQYFKQSAVFPAQNYASIGVVASIQLFDGGRTYAAISEASAKGRIAELETQQMVKQIRQEVKEAYLNLDTINRTLETFEIQLKLAKENYELNSSLYEVGDATALELSTAQNSYDQARIAYLNMKFQKDIAILNLKRAMGELIKDN